MGVHFSPLKHVTGPFIEKSESGMEKASETNNGNFVVFEKRLLAFAGSVIGSPCLSKKRERKIADAKKISESEGRIKKCSVLSFQMDKNHQCMALESYYGQ